MVTGSIVGYSIGHYMWISPLGGFTSLAQYFFSHIPGFTIDLYTNTQALYAKWSYGILFSAIILPIPYQLYSITAGAFDINVLIFGFSTLVFQGLRFFGLAFLVIKFGEGVKTIFHKNLKIIAFSTAGLLLLYVVFTVILR